MQFDQPCKNCVFAVYEEDTQTSCKHDRIRLFEEIGAEIIEAYDNDKEFFVIKNRKCNLYREPAWGKQYPKRKWKEQARKEIVFPFDLIIEMRSGQNTHDLAMTLGSINEDIPPRTVIVVLAYGFDEKEVPNILASMKSLGFPWKLDRITDPDVNTLDVAFKNVKQTYYGVFQAGYTIPHNFFTIINEFMNEKMGRFSCLEPDQNSNGLVVQTLVHRDLGGNCPLYAENGELKEVPILEKVKRLAELNNSPHMVKKFEDL